MSLRASIKDFFEPGYLSVDVARSDLEMRLRDKSSVALSYIVREYEERHQKPLLRRILEFPFLPLPITTKKKYEFAKAILE